MAACGRRERRLYAVIPKATSHLFFLTVKRGVDEAAREFGVDVDWNGPRDETDHSRQIQILDAAVARSVAGIAISATDERALAAPVERAIAAGIPVVAFDSTVDARGLKSVIATDNRGAGELAARTLGGLVGGKRKVAMVMQKPGGTSTGLRESGFEETLAREFPGATLAAKQYSMADAARAYAAAENILTAHSDLSGMFASSEASSLGAIRAIEARGLAGRVKLVTFDTSETHVAALRDGTIDVMLVQDARKLGHDAVEALVQAEYPARVAIPVQSIREGDLARPEARELITPPDRR
ncbi:MAG: substrate-binding domain-containing protein [Bryobacteraceae bacterium]|nr:substrate-binding domain-containing protein [Bryobacteraceae bacterium]